MTTSRFGIPGAATRCSTRSFTLRKRARATSQSALYAVADFASVVACVQIAIVRFRLPFESFMFAGAIGVLAVLHLHLAGAYRASQSPLNILEFERLLRGLCWALASLSFTGWLLTGAGWFRFSYIALALIVVAMVLAERKLVASAINAGAPRRLARRALIYTAQGPPGTPAKLHTLYCTDERIEFGASPGPCMPSRTRPRGEWLKRAFDLLLSILLLIALMPFLLVIAFLVWYDSPGPVFFRQRRIGRYGERFTIVKFRSMYANVPQYEVSPQSNYDPRLTRIGKVLRRFSLDELPQLFNVLKGEMSLVGPRPEMPFIVEQYGPSERRRLQCKPGMTGLWQISPARCMPIHTNMQYDLFYIERQNFFLDLAILLCTFKAVIRIWPARAAEERAIEELAQNEAS